MRRVKRYRRATTVKALKPWSPLYVLDHHEATSAVLGGGW